jgi:hypothetical protein
MKIKLSKSQWKFIGKTAGWDEHVDAPKKQLIDMQQQIIKMQDDFRNISANLPKENWDAIAGDCDIVVEYLDNVAGRISTIIHKIRMDI